ncbi:MAG: hypothetical protein Q8O76_00280 [Chloroflexota bacterium]|nr:hypothetical protein [Chloroflexota bacterium]
MEWRHYHRAPGRGAAQAPGEILKGEEFPCAFCRGTGGLRKTNSQCPVCRGQALVRVPAPAVACAYCRGRGETPVLSGITCIVCLGKGLVTVHEPLEACPHCRGTGAEPNNKLPCLVCRGKGVVTTK